MIAAARAGTETALARMVAVFGAAKPHCAYLFANRRANRMKVLVHDGVGIWLAARRLNQGKFHWPGIQPDQQMSVIIEVPFGQQTLTVKWPSSNPEGCARFIRGLTR